MTFYQSLSSYYDKIFPLNDIALSFVSSYFSKGDKVLDIGAGTGNLALALAEAGFQVTASEPDIAMMENISEKSKSRGLPLAIHSKSMEQITELSGNFDGIICVGNTLPHLQSKESIEQFIAEAFMKLNDNGKLILQLVNYENALSNKDFSFPIIEKDDFTFTRHYALTNEKVMFTSRLTVSGETVENTIPLTPITSTALLPILEKVGFQQIDVFGNFKGEPYTELANALICVARK